MPNSAILLPSGEKHDYAPYGQIADPTVLDTAIMALSPWAYWPLTDGGTGNFADVSGNGRNAYAELGPTYRQQPAITSKTGPTVWLGNDRIGFPVPQANLSTQSGSFSYMGIIKINTIFAPGSPVGNRYLGSTFLHQAIDGAGASPGIKLGFQDVADGGCLVVQSGSQADSGASNIAQAGKALVIAVNGTSLLNLIYTFDIWVNGVKVVSGYNRGNGSQYSARFCIGRLGNTERMAEFWASNWFAMSRALLDAEIMHLTECYLDKNDYAGAWKPR